MENQEIFLKSVIVFLIVIQAIEFQHCFSPSSYIVLVYSSQNTKSKHWKQVHRRSGGFFGRVSICRQQTEGCACGPKICKWFIRPIFSQKL